MMSSRLCFALLVPLPLWLFGCGGGANFTDRCTLDVDANGQSFKVQTGLYPDCIVAASVPCLKAGGCPNLVKSCQSHPRDSNDMSEVTLQFELKKGNKEACCSSAKVHMKDTGGPSGTDDCKDVMMPGNQLTQWNIRLANGPCETSHRQNFCDPKQVTDAGYGLVEVESCMKFPDDWDDSACSSWSQGDKDLPAGCMFPDQICMEYHYSAASLGAMNGSNVASNVSVAMLLLEAHTNAVLV